LVTDEERLDTRPPGPPGLTSLLYVAHCRRHIIQ